MAYSTGTMATEKRCGCRDCPKKGQLQPIEAFGIDRRRADGRNGRCKHCVLRSCHRTRGRTASDRSERLQRTVTRLEQNVRAANTALQRRRVHGYHVERDALAVLAEHALSVPPYGCALHQLHDGTKADYALRFGGVGCHNGWLPQQLKSCSASQAPFKFQNCDKQYECGIVCVAPYASPPRVFAFTAEFVAKNTSLLSGSDIRIGIHSSVWHTGEMTIDAYFQWAAQQWSVPGNTLPLRTLELQASRNSQLEYCMGELAAMLDSDATIFLPDVRNDVVDRLVNGQRVQDKCARRPPGATGVVARLSHTSASVPYSIGDNDLYCIHCVADGGRLYMQWMFPEAKLVAQGVVSQADADGWIVKAGSGTIACHAAANHRSASTEARSIQRNFLGGYPRKAQSSWTAQHFRSMRVPPEFEWPAGVWG